MTTLREAAQQALSAIEDTGHKADLVAAASALRAALEQPEPEPVAWQWLDTAYFGKQIPADVDPAEWRPLYAVPPIEQTAVEKWKRMANVMGEYRKPLSDAGLMQIWETYLDVNRSVFFSEFKRIAGAIELAHGIEDEK